MRGAAGKILIIDKDEKLSLSLRGHLPGHIHRITAHSREQVLQCLTGSNDIGVIVGADLERLTENGKSLPDEISKCRPEIRHISIVADPETWNAEHRRGVFRLLTKPCKPDMLALVIIEALHEYAFLTRSVAEQEAYEIDVQADHEARKAFVATMRHELLTPLNHVLGFSSMLEMKMDENKEEAREYLRHIKSSGESLLKLLKRVLEIMRLTSGETDRERSNTNIDSLIVTELEAAQHEARDCGIALSYQEAPAPIMASVNEYDLRFALQELIGNAIKFNSPGGQVSVAARREQDQLLIRISDTGKGMTRETVCGALGLFTVGGSSADCCVHVPGGLGVTFAAVFARAYGGHFVIEDKKDVGMAIILTLPCGEKADAPGSLAQTA